MKKFFFLVIALTATAAAFAQNNPKATYDLIIGLHQTWYDETIPAWGVTIEDFDEEYSFQFIFNCDSIMPGHTYTLNDMDAQYTMGVDRAYHPIRLDSVWFTKDLTEGRLHYSIRMVDQNSNIWNFHYDELEPCNIHDTVDIVFNSNQIQFIDHTSDWGVFQFIGSTHEQSASICCISEDGIAGTYTSLNGDFFPSYTGVSLLDSSNAVMSTYFNSGHVVVTEANGGYRIEAYLVCYDSVCYHVGMNYNTSVAIAETAPQAVSVYPNPATDRITVLLPDNCRSIELTNLLGQPLLIRQANPSLQTSNTSQSPNTQEIDVSTLPRGIYLLRLHTPEGIQTKKIILQ